jgi:hypothetical protein
MPHAAIDTELHPCLVHVDPPRLITPLGRQLQQRIAPADDGGRQAASGMMRQPAP